MAILKCKMCGGSLEVQEGTTVFQCEYCGSTQTLPSVTDETLQMLFNRANILRMKSEFDKAADIYEKILQTKDDEAEAYWGLILCKYGIEYVEDPSTFKRVPTCHRASYDVVTVDEDYKNALKYADAFQRSIYESEASAIDEIQKGIIALAQKADPYDVFICYKETDEFGKRTQDSVIANDIYHQLTAEGFKVFYAAITLEDKLGSEYEPYIFSALTTAKVMLAIGTKPEFFNAVWVKNEWSRFLKVMKKDRSRLLIPCYRGMDPYELPEEFAHLQAQDMNKIGFINDIVRGIKKVIVKENKQTSVKEVIIQQGAGNTTVHAQIQRGNIALEDHDWEKADSFFEEALNLDPKCAEAYIGKLLAREKKPGFDSWVSFQKGKFSSTTTENLEACSIDKAYVSKISRDYSVPGFLESDVIQKQFDYNLIYTSSLSCRKEQKAKQLGEISADRLLSRAKQYADGETKKMLDAGLEEITSLLDQRIEDAKRADEASIARVKNNYTTFLSETTERVQNLNSSAQSKRDEAYQNALTLKQNGNFEKAIKIFEKMKGYLDSAELIEACSGAISDQLYDAAIELYEHAKDISEFEIAKDKLSALHGYKDSNELIQKCVKSIQKLKEEKELEERKQAEALKLKAEKEKKKKKMTIIVAASIVVIIAIAIASLTSYTKGAPYRELTTALDDGSFSTEWVSSSGDKVVSNWDKKALDIVANKLGEYHTNDDVEHALALITVLMERGIKIDGEYFYASYSFIEWIKEKSISDGNGSNDGEDYNYTVFGYKIKWNANMMMDQFYLYVPSENDWCIVMGDNTFYKISSSEKSCIQ